MKDGPPSEEALMNELDNVYRRVANLENGEVAAERDLHALEQKRPPDHGASPHEKIIPFPAHRIHAPSAEASEGEPKEREKPSYRSPVIVACLSMTFLGLTLMVILGRAMMESGDADRSNVPAHRASSLVVQNEQVAGRPGEKATEEGEFLSPETKKSRSLLTDARDYAVQVGAFRNLENARSLVDALNTKGLDAYWITMGGKKGEVLYHVFSGHFIDKSEAAEFMNDRQISRDCPGSFVREIPFQEGHR